MIELHNRSTKLVLARPDVATPYYRGTRFDRSGIILSLESRGRKYVSQWFREYDPFNHDAVGGPAEEFSPIGYDNADPGGGFLKPGVGLLERDVDEYDHFRLYKVLDEGERDFKAAPGQAEFRHRMAAGGYSYDYMKRIIIPREGTLVLEHILKNTGKGIMDMYVYNHNFFVLDGAPTGKATVITLPFKPQGHWRDEYDSVALTDNGIRFARDLRPGETIFMGDLNGSEQRKNYSFRLANTTNGLTVDARSDAAMEYAVFWCNHEVACLEPYTHLLIEPGRQAEWKIEYHFGTM